MRKSINSFGYDKPDSSSVEFGLNFNEEGNLFFAEVSAEATVRLTVNWGTPKDGRAGGETFDVTKQV